MMKNIQLEKKKKKGEVFTNLRTQLQHLHISAIVTVKSVRVIMSNGVKQQMLWVCLHYLIFLIHLVNPALKQHR